MLLVSNTDAKVSRSCTNHMTRPALMSGHSASLTGPCRGTRGGKTERDSSAARKNGFYRYEYTNAHSHAYAPKYCANVRGASQVWKSISLSIGACKRVNQKIEHTVATCHDCLARRACTFYSLFFLKKHLVPTGVEYWGDLPSFALLNCTRKKKARALADRSCWEAWHPRHHDMYQLLVLLVLFEKA